MPITRSQSKMVPAATATATATATVVAHTPRTCSYNLKTKQIDKKQMRIGTSSRQKILQWHSDRDELLQQYRDEPICRFVREIKETRSTATFDFIVKYLGQIKGPQLLYNFCIGYINTPDEQENLMTLVNALKIACPNIQCKVTSSCIQDLGKMVLYSYLGITWKEGAGSMSKAVLNGHIFPRINSGNSAFIYYNTDSYCIDVRTLKY